MIVPDLLGYGRTDTPKDYDQYKEREIAGDVLAILDEEGVDKSFIVGHDWYVAFKLVAMHRCG